MHRFAVRLLRQSDLSAHNRSWNDATSTENSTASTENSTATGSQGSHCIGNTHTVCNQLTLDGHDFSRLLCRKIQDYAREILIGDPPSDHENLQRDDPNHFDEAKPLDRHQQPGHEYA